MLQLNGVSRIFNRNGVFGVKVGRALASPPSQRGGYGPEDLESLSTFMIMCAMGSKKKHTTLEVFRKSNPVHCIYTRIMSMVSWHGDVYSRHPREGG